MEKEKRPVGRPAKPIDWKLVDQLILAGCTGVEIAANFHIHADTLYRQIENEYGTNFTDYAAQYYQKGDSLLKVKQFEKALEKDNTMLIWLGKQRLGQKEPEKETATISQEDWAEFKRLQEFLAQKKQPLENKATEENHSC